MMTQLSIRSGIKLPGHKSGSLSKDWVLAIFFLAPVVIFVAIFAFYPAFYAVYLSFFESKFLVFNREFVGLSNYVDVLTSSTFWSPFWKTLVFTFWCVVFQFSLGMIMALSLQRQLKVNNILRAIIIIPWILSPVVIAVIFQFLYIPDRAGILNYMLMSAGIVSEPVAWLGVDTAMTMVIVANIWFGMPFCMVMLLAGIQSIDKDIYEASLMDGASKVRQFWYITLPLLKPTTMVTLIWITTSTFNEFDLVYALTSGGPLDSTSLLGIQMYNMAFKYGEFEKGSALAVLMFLINLLMSIIYLRMLKNKEA
ncbi:carbohydrate ABC transporter permease [Gynuella sp.]|uniref:carbohydrate ABC transporter permease n=1 Tax=Gynuella sp. TaxID=2969146 RepID=UPI003D097287